VGGNPHAPLTEAKLLLGESPGLAAEENRRVRLLSELGDLPGHGSRSDGLDPIAGSSRESSDVDGADERCLERVEDANLLQDVLGVPGHPPGLDGLEVAGSDEVESVEPGVGDDPRHRADVLGTLGAVENDAYASHDFSVVDENPYFDVAGESRSFTLPLRKWRELLFIGALVADGDGFVRDSARPLPRFRDPNLFPEGKRFRVRPEGPDRVRVERLD
jgi:hypothetical protein